MPRFRDPLEEKERPPRRERDGEFTDRERRSWREIDAKRDRSAHVQPDSPEARQVERKRRGEALAKKALEELFSGKKTKEQEAAWKKVCEATGSLFSKRASAYIEKHGIPRSWDDLLRLLDHDDSAFVSTLLDRMMELSVHETEVRRDLLVGKLRVMKMTEEDPALIVKIDRCMQALSAQS